MPQDGHVWPVAHMRQTDSLPVLRISWSFGRRCRHCLQTKVLDCSAGGWVREDLADGWVGEGLAELAPAGLAGEAEPPLPGGGVVAFGLLRRFRAAASSWASLFSSSRTRLPTSLPTPRGVPALAICARRIPRHRLASNSWPFSIRASTRLTRSTRAFETTAPNSFGFSGGLELATVTCLGRLGRATPRSTAPRMESAVSRRLTSLSTASE